MRADRSRARVKRSEASTPSAVCSNLKKEQKVSGDHKVFVKKQQKVSGDHKVSDGSVVEQRA